ncbi:DnaJ family domain-containing protein [Actinomadura sediminis]|uniref:DUF1992 domain-containing protein n=1 Tax=Actinomadura sediminis TaxID=1038904 RepID=A0ABW3ESU3_9ACTN
MTERKPAGMGFESWIDRQIRQARERGEFDDLPGAGKPLPRRGEAFSMDQWIVDKARREGLDTEAMLPEPLRLRKEIDRLPDAVRELRSEEEVRELAAELNRRIAASLRRPSELPIVLRRVDPDALVEQWRSGAGETGERSSAAPRRVAERRGRRGFWRRRKPRS